MAVKKITSTLGDWENILADEIQKEIDNGILVEMLVASGWIKIELPPFQVKYHAPEIIDWANQNCQSEFKEFSQYSRVFVFKDAKDATAFALKWL